MIDWAFDVQRRSCYKTISWMHKRLSVINTARVRVFLGRGGQAEGAERAERRDRRPEGEEPGGVYPSPFD